MSETPMYWNGRHGLGSGPDAIKKGDLLPENFNDPRLKKWIENKTVTTDKVVSFDSEQIKELEDSQIKVMELEEKNGELEKTVKDQLKLIQKAKVVSGEKDALELKVASYQEKIDPVIDLLKQDSIKKEEKTEMVEKLETLKNA